MANKIIVAYVPVLHRGYLEFFKRYPEAKQLYLLGASATGDFEPLQKDIRALPLDLMKRAIEALNLFDAVNVADVRTLRELAQEGLIFVMPDEDTSELVRVQTPLAKSQVELGTFFLRWDRKSSLAPKEVRADRIVSMRDSWLVNDLMRTAVGLSQKSSDWWRQVGAVAARGPNFLLAAYNDHLPSEQSPYILGDPRANFHKGEHIELSTAEHAEAAIIARAAGRKDFSLADADLYVTDFPCPPCAKLIAGAGIKRLYFLKGYAMLDGEQILHAAGVEIIQVVE